VKTPLRNPAEFRCGSLYVALGSSYVTVAELRHDDRLRGVADGRQLLSQLVNRSRDARPDIEAAWLFRGLLDGSDQCAYDIVDIDEVAKYASVFVDLEGKLFA
jgi:hypothetical protein